MPLIFALYSLMAVAAVKAPPEKFPAGLCPFDAAKIPDNFTPALRRDIPDAEIAHLFRRREEWYGPCTAAEPIGHHKFRLKYEGATVEYVLDQSKGKIEQLGFGDTTYPADSWDKFNGFLQKNWPSASFYTSTGGEQHGFRENEALPVSDGRNLLILAELEKKERAGELKNTQPVALAAGDLAENAGRLAAAKPGTKVTIGRLKEILFNDFDRNAAEVLLRVVTPAALENGHPENTPFLTRREFAWLMTLPPEKLAALKPEDLKKVAASLDQPGVIPPLPSERYDYLDKIGWRASARTLCDSLRSVSAVPELKGGKASSAFRFDHPGWSGGVYQAAREFGVAQTTWVAKLPGQTQPTCFSIVLNLKDLREEEAGEVQARAERLLLDGLRSRASAGQPITCMQ